MENKRTFELVAFHAGEVNVKYDDYSITTDKELMHVDSIHRWLSENSFWAKGTSYEEVKIAFDHSFCVGVLFDGCQIGYARLVTDYVYFGYLRDVYIEKGHRKKGLAKMTLQLLLSLNWVKKLKHIELSSRDAKGFYEQLGFESLENMQNRMVLRVKTTNQVS